MSGIYNEYYNAQTSFETDYGANSIVLMMVGSFYEIYGVILSNDKVGKVEEARNILGMNMSLKNKSFEHSKTNPYMVGFPDYALDEHLGKFLRANMCVALYNQYDIKDSAKKDRKLTRIFTPSTFIDDTLSESNNLLTFELISYKSPITLQMMNKVHVAVISLNTGKVHLLEAYDTNSDTGKATSELYRIIHSYNPNEIICCGKQDSKLSKLYDLGNKKLYFREIPKNYFKSSYQNEFLKNIYKKTEQNTELTPIEFIEMEKHTSVLPYFIQAMQFAFEHDKLIVCRIQKPKFIENDELLVLNNDSIYQLNLIASPFELSNTLYEVVCKAKTAMGKRCIRERLLAPTMNINVLETRYNLIEEMQPIYKKYEVYLLGISDIEKKYRKMVLKTIQPYEFADLDGTWSIIIKLLKFSRKLFSIPNSVIDEFKLFYNDYSTTFDFSIMKKCKLNDIKDSFFRIGINKELDDLFMEIINNKQKLTDIAEYISKIIEPTKEVVVKLDSTEKEGFYLTTTTKRFKKLPKDFSYNFIFNDKEYTINYDSLELVTLTNSVKIRSLEIKKISKNIIMIQEIMKKKIIDEYFKKIDYYVESYGDLFINLADIIANIDFIYSAAKISVEYGYTRPIISNLQDGTSFVNVEAIRHPIVERINEEEEYITNDISLGLDNHNGSIVYGLNMSGKSTLLKALGCNIILAQTGMYTSCSNFEFYPFRNLLSKMTIRDNMSKGQSTFMVEMIEVKNMLMRADKNTIILSDELCSSTESTSAHAIVAQTLQSLTEKGAKFIFSTHLHELQKIKLITENPTIQIYHFKVHINNNEIVFDRRIEKGGMTDLYGLEVARALGLPDTFMKGAFQIRDMLLEQPTEILTSKSSKYNSKVYVHSCSKCGKFKDLHTHHINQQKDADENGLIQKRFHKNSKFNLQILCKDCHELEHA